MFDRGHFGQSVGREIGTTQCESHFDRRGLTGQVIRARAYRSRNSGDRLERRNLQYGVGFRTGFRLNVGIGLAGLGFSAKSGTVWFKIGRLGPGLPANWTRIRMVGWVSAIPAVSTNLAESHWSTLRECDHTGERLPRPALLVLYSGSVRT